MEKWKQHIIRSYVTSEAQCETRKSKMCTRRMSGVVKHRKKEQLIHVGVGVDGEVTKSTEGEGNALGVPTPPLNIAFIVISFLRCRTRSASSAPPVIFNFLPPTKFASSECSSSVRFASSCCLIFWFRSMASSRRSGSTTAPRISSITVLKPVCPSSGGGGRYPLVLGTLDALRIEITFSTCPKISVNALWSS